LGCDYIYIILYSYSYNINIAPGLSFASFALSVPITVITTAEWKRPGDAPLFPTLKIGSAAVYMCRMTAPHSKSAEGGLAFTKPVQDLLFNVNVIEGLQKVFILYIIFNNNVIIHYIRQ